MPKSKDPELKAMEGCLALLRPLTEAARQRVLGYVSERLAAETANHGGSSQ